MPVSREGVLSDWTNTGGLQESDEDARVVRGFTFLSQKPILHCVNLDEKAIGDGPRVVERFDLKRVCLPAQLELVARLQEQLDRGQGGVGIEDVDALGTHQFQDRRSNGRVVEVTALSPHHDLRTGRAARPRGRKLGNLAVADLHHARRAGGGGRGVDQDIFPNLASIAHAHA